MAEKEKKVKVKTNSNALMIDRLSSYKWIKFCQSLVLIVMGVLFICMNSVPEFTNFITIGFSITLLIYSILEIFGAIMLKKSILSTEIFVSLMIFAVALMVICNPGLRDLSYLTWFFGILIIGYSLILITSGVLALTIDADDEKYGTNKTKRIFTSVVEFVGAGILIALDICLWIFGPKAPGTSQEDKKIVLIAILIGVALIFMGIASMFYGFQAIKTEKILKKQEEANKTSSLEPKDEKAEEEDTVDTAANDSHSDDSSIVTVEAQENGIVKTDDKAEEKHQETEDEIKQIEDSRSKKNRKKNK